MNRKILATAMGAVAVMMALPAAAQTTKPMGLSIRAGLVFPTSGYGRGVGKNWFGVGGEFKIQDANFGTMDRSSTGMITISADYYGKGEASAVPVLVNYVGTNKEFYYSFGAGLAISRDKVNGNSRNKTNFAYSLGLGYNFQSGTNPLFVEGRFFGNSNSNLNGIGLYVGVRL